MVSNFAVFHKNLTARNRKSGTVLKDQRLISAASFVGHKWVGEWHRALADAMACHDVWLFLDKQEAAVKEAIE